MCPQQHRSRAERRDEFSTTSSSVEHYYYHYGISAQSYKPHSPTKNNVCHVHSRGMNKNDSVGGEGGGGGWRVANRPFWRSEHDVVPLVVVGTIYGCVEESSHSSSSSSSSTKTTTPSSSSTSSSYIVPRDDDVSMMTMEVWQPRPDGTYSSLRPGVEEGECRARVPVNVGSSSSSSVDDANVMEGDGESSSYSNVIGNFRYETLVPGSPGLLGGLVPKSGGGDYPPYGPGMIHMYLNIRGYRPLLDILDTNDLYDWSLPLRDDTMGRDRFRFRGWDMRPHAARTMGNAKVVEDAGGYGGVIEIRSLTRETRHGYDLALEVKVDVFLVNDATGGGEGDVTVDPIDVFCKTRRGFLGWIRSFFKMPIAICFPSLLDFFSL